MPFETFDFDTLSSERRKAVAKSIRPATPEELKKMGDEIFRYADDPWRDLFFQFLADNHGASFHYAETNDGVHIVYCRDKERGIWFMPGSGKGPLPERGLKAMKEIVDGLH